MDQLLQRKIERFLILLLFDREILMIHDEEYPKNLESRYPLTNHDIFFYKHRHNLRTHDEKGGRIDTRVKNMATYL